LDFGDMMAITVIHSYIYSLWACVICIHEWQCAGCTYAQAIDSCSWSNIYFVCTYKLNQYSPYVLYDCMYVQYMIHSPNEWSILYISA
jgi:hypothetical protein